MIHAEELFLDIPVQMFCYVYLAYGTESAIEWAKVSLDPSKYGLYKPLIVEELEKRGFDFDAL